MMKKEFHCPQCGSSHFGGFPSRQCKGARVIQVPETGHISLEPCTFAWNVSDDWRYEQTVIRARGPNDKSAEIAKKAVVEYWRSGPLADFEE